jgi:hypothetical protein
MSTTQRPGTQPSPNIFLTPDPGATSTLCSYPLDTQRRDMSSKEWTAYKNEWYVFDRIWIHNYTASTLNATQLIPNTYKPWQFISKNEQIGYSNGQLAHIAFYSTAGGEGQFNNIRVIQ